MNSLHLHYDENNNPHFHVDTFSFSSDSSLFTKIMHGFWDGFIGTLFFDTTGLPLF